MSITHLQEAKELREQGKRLGREGMSQRVLYLVEEFMKTDGSYKGAIRLSGRLHAIFIAAKSDDYWREKATSGYTQELFDIASFIPDEKQS